MSFQKSLILAVFGALILIAKNVNSATAIGHGRTLQAQMATADMRLAEAKKFALRLGQGQSLYVEVVQPELPDGPVLVRLPGLVRSLLVNEASTIELAKAGFGIINLNLSVQALSIATLGDGEEPSFVKKDPSLTDLADEMSQAIEKIKNEYDFTNLIPVSLSYTAALSAQLKGFPLIIETVPMTSTAAASPKSADYAILLRMQMMFNPFLDESYFRDLMDSAYRKAMAPLADNVISVFNLPANRRDETLSGLVALARAGENFEWKDVTLPQETRRVFIVAENDDLPLLRHQIRTFKTLQESRNDAVLIYVKESVHLIPFQQPKMYAQVIKLLISNQLGTQSGVVIVTPSADKIETLQNEQASEFLNQF